MPRRYRPERRKVEPDIRYSSERVARFVNKVMRDGKRSVAEGLVYDSFDAIAERTGQDPLEVFETALRNVMPTIEVKPRRVGGATYQVPVEVRQDRRNALAMRWLINYSRDRNEKSMHEKLAAEVLAASKGEGNAIKKKEDTHRMAEANKAFAHYRW